MRSERPYLGSEGLDLGLGGLNWGLGGLIWSLKGLVLGLGGSTKSVKQKLKQIVLSSSRALRSSRSLHSYFLKRANRLPA